MASTRQRIMAGLVAGVCLTLLAVAAALKPAAEGHGTHTQLGLPSCAWAVMLDKPCPTCGMTTAVTAAVHDGPIRAGMIQPMGALIALGASVMFWGAASMAVFGTRLDRVAGPLLHGRVLWVAGAAWMASWIYKVAVW